MKTTDKKTEHLIDQLDALEKELSELVHLIEISFQQDLLLRNLQLEIKHLEENLNDYQNKNK